MVNKEFVNLMKERKSEEEIALPNIREWKFFKYSDIFLVKKGQGPTQKEAKKTSGVVPYVSAQEGNNAHAFYCGVEPTHKAGSITVSDFGRAFFQPVPFVGSHIVVFEPKFKITPQIGIFICQIINRDSFKYSFGRSFSISKIANEGVVLPADKDGNIDTELITRYMNSLSYSKYL